MSPVKKLRALETRHASQERPRVRTSGPQTEAAPPMETTVSVRAAELLVREGPDAPRGARIDVPTFVVGAGERADLRLTDPTVSREHVRLSLEDGGVRLRDEGSRNGTWLGAVRVRDALVMASTMFNVGQTSIALSLDAGAIELAIASGESFGDAIAVSTAMRHVVALLERAAPSDATVLLEGESGVGKEILARATHEASPRAEGPFVAIDCGALPATLIESELFGHERGAFTGAQTARRGLFEQARGGTVFLDEIGELPLELQPKLLRVLEQREVRPLGAHTARPIDVRIIAATNRRLAEATATGAFRRDLYYRLAVATVTIPPLRDRADDVVPLARAFIRRALSDDEADLPADFAAMLRSYAWPGNVRELRNVVERYVLFGANDAHVLFGASHPPLATSGDLSHLPFHEARKIAMDRFENAYFPKVLARAEGVVTRAAELAEVARPSFHRFLDRIRGPKRETR